MPVPGFGPISDECIDFYFMIPSIGHQVSACYKYSKKSLLDSKTKAFIININRKRT